MSCSISILLEELCKVNSLSLFSCSLLLFSCSHKESQDIFPSRDGGHFEQKHFDVLNTDSRQSAQEKIPLNFHTTWQVKSVCTQFSQSQRHARAVCTEQDDPRVLQ